MRSTALNLSRYNSDKISGRYLERYDPLFGPLAEKEISLLELGVYKGGSLLLWKDYFPKGKITGIDINPPQHFDGGERISVFKGSQADTRFLSEVALKTAPEGYDIIIDDASHVGALTKISFWHLFKHHLKPGGMYVIEDWGTGYWSNWSDGKNLDLDRRYKPGSIPFGIKNPFLLKVMLKLISFFPMKGHNYGMVGFIKQLVDEQAAADVTNWSRNKKRESRFENILITPSIVFIKKSKN